MDTIYFDNASTTFPKPKAVPDAMYDYMTRVGSNVNRGCYERAYEAYRRDIRPVMIHAQLVGQDQLPRMKELGMIPSFFVAHVYHWGDVHLENFGPQRAANISPAAAAGALGIPYTFHQDAPVIEPNMLETIWCAVNRVTKQGVSLGPQQRVSALDAVRAVTIHAAHQYFEEHQKGSLAAGKHADFVILSADPTAVPPMQIRNIEVLATIKDGQCIFEKEMPEA